MIFANIAHLIDADVQVYGCFALLNLAWSDKFLQESVLNGGGLEVIQKARQVAISFPTLYATVMLNILYIFNETQVKFFLCSVF